MLKEHFNTIFSGKRVAILGFGREGRSTLRKISEYVSDVSIIVCDRNPGTLLPEEITGEARENIELCAGEDYLRGLGQADIIVKSPGIPWSVLRGHRISVPVTSQTGIFLSLYRNQVIGITGTKGKSTTASLLASMLQAAGGKALLLGNIGVPCFDEMENILPETRIVFEMSSHQLEGLEESPYLGILLNIFEEHLDHYASYEAYQQAKLNIVRWQKPGDTCIYNGDDAVISKQVPGLTLPSRQIVMSRKEVLNLEDTAFAQGDDLVCRLSGKEHRLKGLFGKSRLTGGHNRVNITAAAVVALLLGIPEESIFDALRRFGGLPHRLEYVGTYRGVTFYNDSIATIPEATLAAVSALPGTSTLILGGKDRGVHFEEMLQKLGASEVMSFIFTGDAGRRMKQLAERMSGFRGKHLYMAASFDEAVTHAVRTTPEGRICLLSPAASSYDAFPNFEARGHRFKELIQEL